MSTQLNTSSMQLYFDYYDPDKGDRRYSSTVMQPVEVSIDVPLSLPNRAQVLALLDSSRDNGEPLEIEYVSGTNRYKQPQFTIYGAKTVKPLIPNKA